MSNAAKMLVVLAAIALAIVAVYILLLRKGAALNPLQGHVTGVYQPRGASATAGDIAGQIAGSGAQALGTAGCAAYGGPPQLCAAAGKFTGAVGKILGEKTTSWIEGLF